MAKDISRGLEDCCVPVNNTKGNSLGNPKPTRTSYLIWRLTAQTPKRKPMRVLAHFLFHPKKENKAKTFKMGLGSGGHHMLHVNLLIHMHG